MRSAATSPTGVSLDRRTLLAVAAGCVAASAVPAVRGPAPAGLPHPAAYALASWEQLVGSVLGSGHGAVRLVTVTGQASAAGDRFRLGFRSLGGPALPSHLWVRHPRLGPVPFFVTTTGPSATAVVDGRKG